ncbi:MAG: hypothetical protein F6J86_16690 [Symploca sp. SIO1B1]|nr:hypothetical protein [Symploca sp. SIO1C2]NER95449.1 hypothetical protein [Symploca sp. SIO1B1]
MPQTILNHILEQLQSLELSELQQLDQAVQDYLTHQEQAAKTAAFHQSLITSGLVRKIKKNSGKQSIRRQLLEIPGEPLSRTVVEERR